MPVHLGPLLLAGCVAKMVRSSIFDDPVRDILPRYSETVETSWRSGSAVLHLSLALLNSLVEEVNLNTVSVGASTVCPHH